ncbi:hypothetical protein HY406_00580 [Candidatus Giovannonibacteria bacterium]|nr:hypothetical protein [Candidatus Giovannonibacteria bacterium]
MSRKSDVEAAIDRSVKHEVGARMLADIVKRADMDTASALIFFYRLYPEELLGELEMIKSVFDDLFRDRNDYEMVLDFILWYQDRYIRELREMSGLSVDGFKPKTELDIFKRWAEKQRKIAQSLDVIKLSMELGRLTSD